MDIAIATPAPPHSTSGNRITADRWARHLRDLGHRVTIGAEAPAEGGPADLLVALHARKSAAAAREFRARRPGAPLVVAIAGTDLDPGAAGWTDTLETLRLADLVVALQPRASDTLPPDLRERLRVLLQSAEPADGAGPPRDDAFEVCVLAHLRAVKDPLLPARAARLLPSASRIEVLLCGRVIEEEMGREAEVEAAANPRFRWLGEVPHVEARRLLARARLCVLSSRLEGGANVIGEASVADTPVLATAIPGSTGLLGEDHPGLFPVGDEAALGALLSRAETNASYRDELAGATARLAPLFDPLRERDGWAAILKELFPARTPSR